MNPNAIPSRVLVLIAADMLRRGCNVLFVYLPPSDGGPGVNEVRVRPVIDVVGEEVVERELPEAA